MKYAGGKERIIDHTLRPHFEGDVLMVGEGPIRVDYDGSIIIAVTTYKTTPGLYNLLFKRLPNDAIYNIEDLWSFWPKRTPIKRTKNTEVILIAICR